MTAKEVYEFLFGDFIETGFTKDVIIPSNAQAQLYYKIKEGSAL
jgi:hypothetical protein